MGIERELLNKAIEWNKQAESLQKAQGRTINSLRQENEQLLETLNSIERKAKTGLSDTSRDIREREYGDSVTTGQPTQPMEKTTRRNPLKIAGLVMCPHCTAQFEPGPEFKLVDTDRPTNDPHQ